MSGLSKNRSKNWTRLDFDTLGTDGNCDLMLLHPRFFAIHALQGITFKGAECDIAHEIQQGICDGATKDTVAQAVMGLAKLQGRSHCADEWRQVDGLWYLCDKIYIPNILDLWTTDC